MTTNTIPYVGALSNIIADLDELTEKIYDSGDKKHSERLRDLAAELYWLYHEMVSDK
jgi:hypothetical protein